MNFSTTAGGGAETCRYVLRGSPAEGLSISIVEGALAPGGPGPPIGGAAIVLGYLCRLAVAGLPPKTAVRSESDAFEAIVMPASSAGSAAPSCAPTALSAQGARFLAFAFSADPQARLSSLFPTIFPRDAGRGLFEGRPRRLSIGNAEANRIASIAAAIREEFALSLGLHAGGFARCDRIVLYRVLELLALAGRADRASADGEPGLDEVVSRPWSVEDAIRYIDGHFDESFSLELMVRRCALNTTDFSRRFKALAGCPLFEYVNRQRVRRAAFLLKKGEASVLEIALSVGYNSLSFFNRYFHRVMGLTPTEYRRRTLSGG
jgi:AraC-like DNA-binding protein